MSGTKYVDSEVGPPGHGAGMLPRRRLPAAATCKPPEPSEEWGEGRLGGRRADGRAPAGRDSGQGEPGRSSLAGHGEGGCWLPCGKSGVWRGLRREHWDGEGTVMALHEGRYREGGKYSEDSAVRAPCSGPRSGGGRARAARRGRCGEGNAGKPRRSLPCPRGRASAQPAEGPLAPPWGNAAGPGPPGGGSGAGAWHGGGVVWCAPRGRG